MNAAGGGTAEGDRGMTKCLISNAEVLEEML
jgi:hypothetical protein